MLNQRRLLEKSAGQLVPLLSTLNIYGPLLIASNEL